MSDQMKFTAEDERIVSRFTELIAKGLEPTLMKVAAAFSGNKTEIVGELLHSEPVVSIEEDRRDVWVSAFRSAWNGHTHDIVTASDTADAVLSEFDKRFHQTVTTGNDIFD